MTGIVAVLRATIRRPAVYTPLALTVSLAHALIVYAAVITPAAGWAVTVTPALLLLSVSTQARRRWYRWVVLWALVATSAVAQTAILTMWLGQAWIVLDWWRTRHGDQRQAEQQRPRRQAKAPTSASRRR